MRGRAMMNFGIVALSGKLFGGALLTATLLTSSLKAGQIKLANGFPAGMSAIRNRYLNAMCVISGKKVIAGRMANGSDH